MVPVKVPGFTDINIYETLFIFMYTKMLLSVLKYKERNNTRNYLDLLVFMLK